ncbi:MAG: hypothetical protein PHV17_07220 [Candidatus Omnitrophica bacterium]|nr:hypothetical protein [Candidatus Omnitrophota bacterium]
MSKRFPDYQNGRNTYLLARNLEFSSQLRLTAEKSIVELNLSHYEGNIEEISRLSEWPK